jgi:peptidyl-prolyl cis-trans isomerase C
MTPTRFLPPLTALLLAACGGSAPGPAAPDASVSAPLAVPEPGPVVATVDGLPLHQSLLDAIARGRNLDLADPAQRQRALDELVEYAVLVSAARTQPELATTEVRSEIELNALAGRANAVLARVGAIADPDEAALRAEYEQQRAVNGELEYAVTHLLFEDEAPALEAAGQVLSGQGFDAVQQAFKDRAKQATDLGWIKLGQVPPEFARSVSGLQAGQTTPVPVQTSYGWHVIHVRETRPLTVPPFEQVREGIRRMLVANASRAAVVGLKERATIELVADGQ